MSGEERETAGARTCEVCGAALERSPRGGRAALRCAACRGRVARFYGRLYARARARGTARMPEILAWLRAEAVRLAREEAARAPAARAKAARRCAYCGRPARGAYCARCEKEGLDDLHRETGRTSGWDAPAKAARAPAAGGWRGRPVAGGAPDRAAFYRF